ncbi:MAG: hypothetical protein Q8N77_05905 [Nanoarchaeota archaeon]|nr:hypothetical protein [Nanoarchaeota archaeon]
MKKRVTALLLLLLVVFMSGCKSITTGKAAANVCDTQCQQEKDGYANVMNSFLVQIKEVTVKADDWKSVTKEDLEKVVSLRDKVVALNVPEDFKLVHDYYTRAFNHYVEAVTKIVSANNEYSSGSDVSNVAAHNIAMTIVVNNVQEANKILIYADEESKFATRLMSSL